LQLQGGAVRYSCRVSQCVAVAGCRSALQLQGVAVRCSCRVSQCVAATSLHTPEAMARVYTLATHVCVRVCVRGCTLRVRAPERLQSNHDRSHVHA